MYFGPPIFAIAAYLFIASTSGYAFYTTLTSELKAWSKDRSGRRLQQLQGYQLRFPIVGIAIGGCGFLASSLQIFGISSKFSLTIAVPLTLGIGLAIWNQLIKLLNQLERGGVRGLNLEEVSLGDVKIPDSAFAPERPPSRSRGAQNDSNGNGSTPSK
jgi:hypothetical protein